MELRGRPRGPEIADEDAGRLLNSVLDSGINLIDTSPDYGRSEELIGSYIGHRREEFFLASKCGCPLEIPAGASPPYPHDYSPGNVRADVEQSLRRLRTDRLDLVQVHMSPSKATLEQNRTVETLRDLQAEGKVRFIGMSGILPGMSNMEFVLRFTLSHPGLSTTIVGTSNPAHLAGNIAIAGKGPLPADLYEEAKKRLPLP
jgi:aryl-alcohol dehydrogenase-like predicted oxidoreductase